MQSIFFLFGSLLKSLSFEITGFFFLFVFVAFLATPTAINLLTSDNGKAAFAVVDEENNNDAEFEIKDDFQINSYYLRYFTI